MDDQADSVMEAAFGGLALEENDMLIAVMGVTGVGKSTFINRCAGGDSAEVGKTLRACTQEISVHPCPYPTDRNVYLIDTPGFDDTERPDSEVLREIAASFAKFHEKSSPINGIIYLHRISDRRLGGSAMRNLAMFRKLCGDDALQKVILATTMWDNVDEEIGSGRENELKTTPEFWGYMLGKGSSMYRHQDNQESAFKLIEKIVEKSPAISEMPLKLQEEMVKDKLDLGDTAAGQEVDGGIGKELKQAKKDAEEAQKSKQEALKSRDKELAEMMENARLKAEETMQRLQNEHEQLKVNAESLWQERIERLHREIAEERMRNRGILAELQAAQMAQQQHGEAMTQQTSHVRELQDQVAQLMRNPKIRSHPGENTMSQWPVTATLSAKHCWFVAMVRDYGIAPPNFPAEGVLRGNGNSYVSFGVEETWYRRYMVTKGETRTFYNQMSTNFSSVYPKLHTFLISHPNETPVCISLGSEEEYFARTVSNCSHNLPLEVQEHIGDPEEYQSVWLGKDGAYIAQAFATRRPRRPTKNGEDRRHRLDLAWDLKDHYCDLVNVLEELEDSGLRITTAAMNLHDETQYAVVLSDGSARYNSGKTHQLPGFEYEQWCTENFGTTWPYRNRPIGVGPVEASTNVFLLAENTKPGKKADKKHFFRFWKN